MKSIEEYYKYCNKYNKYIKELQEKSYKLHPDKLNELSAIRNISAETLKKLGVFYIGNSVEMMVPEYLDNLQEFGLINSDIGNKPMFEDRYLFPIFDSFGNMINVVGYKKNHDVRYLYANGRYYERADDFFGAECFKDIYELGWCIVVEGITDRVAMMDIGFNNVLATCGTTKSNVKMRELARAKYGVIFIHDRDEAGDLTKKHWVVPRYIELNIASGAKDADEYLNKDRELKAEHSQLMKEAINNCVDWLKLGRCRGLDMNKPVKNICTLL